MAKQFILDTMKEIEHVYQGEKVRTAELRGEVVFRLSDVGSVLGLTNPYRQVADQDRGVHTIETPTRSGMQKVTYISEQNLYRLIFKSRKKEAKGFQDWVFDVVLPALRKKGAYEIGEELRKESTGNRNMLTESWKKHGISKRYHYINLTKEEYKALGYPRDIKKGSMNKEQILTLSALEAMESLKLFHSDANGYYECRDSVKQTGQVLAENKKALIGEGN